MDSNWVYNAKVAWAVSALQKVPLAEVAQAAYENTVKLFNLTL